ncbi:uncharacterized protein [Polyergus mexicanus]|uniref:uncharacterized protein n=1 Tax=Polyergus mexicanus TaxID=615972 RepID=UPI0038B569A3
MEERSVALTSVTREVKINEVLLRFSSFTRLIQVTSFCLRFLRRLRQEDVDPAGCLSVAELERCRLRWLRIAQQQDFSEELRLLSRGKRLPRRSPLLALQSIVNQDGLLRVGGRLQGALLPYEEAHPVILDKSNHLSLLLVRDAHKRSLQAGPQLTRSILVRRYWIIRSNSLIRDVIHHCDVRASETALAINKWHTCR